jgi:hypothetical protein
LRFIEQEHRWPIQAALWLEWGTSTAGRILVRFAEQEHRWPIQAALWLEWGISTAGRILVRFAEQEAQVAHSSRPLA